MKATIYTQTSLGRKAEEMEMTSKELADLRCQVAKSIREWFRWTDYDPDFRHLVYYVEFNGQAYVYRQGMLMDEDNFNELIANRDGVAYACVYHKLD